MNAVCRCFTLAALFAACAVHADSARRLNNLVTELASVSVDAASLTIPFDNPRAGWVYIAITEDAEASLFLDGAAEPLALRAYAAARMRESMRHLPAGPHRLRVENGAGRRVVVRAVPELMYCYYPTKPHIQAYGPYTWEYLERHVLPHVNVLVTRSDVIPEVFQQWLREGRRWVSNASLPGLADKEPPSPDAVYTAWAGNAGVLRPEFSGLIVDEFCDFSRGHFESWNTAVTRLHENAAFKDKRFYAWCITLFDYKPAAAFCESLFKRGDLFVWEQYFDEPANEKALEKETLKPWRAKMRGWRKAYPGIERNMVMCLGYLSAPPETLNVNPAVDYHVFLERQLRTLAMAPEFDGLGGIMEYMADYADEESLRHAHALLRHYAIEGNTEPLNADPYVLPHLQNGDFDSGLDGWEVEPASAGAVSAGKMDKYSWLQGRYPEIKRGNTFCRFRRAADKPNVIRQKLTDLEPGRLYSIKYIAANLSRLAEERPAAFRLTIADAELAEPYAFEYVYPSCYSHEAPPYTRDHPAWFTWGRVVIRPTGTTATLTIADWRSENDAGAPAGEELAVNFVEVQPFHEP